jgi:hypothetical protein
MSHKLGAEIAGGVIGGAVFLAGVGLAKLVTSPFRCAHDELEASKARMAQPVVFFRHVRHEVVIQRANINVIDMGTVEEYDPYDIGNLVDADLKWKADAPRREAEAALNQVFTQAREKQTQAEGGYPWQRQAAWDAEKARKQALRKEKGWLGALLSK